jgi:hypothetical protein
MGQSTGNLTPLTAGCHYHTPLSPSHSSVEARGLEPWPECWGSTPGDSAQGVRAMGSGRAPGEEEVWAFSMSSSLHHLMGQGTLPEPVWQTLA